MTEPLSVGLCTRPVKLGSNAVGRRKSRTCREFHRSSRSCNDLGSSLGLTRRGFHLLLRPRPRRLSGRQPPSLTAGKPETDRAKAPARVPPTSQSREFPGFDAHLTAPSLRGSGSDLYSSIPSLRGPACGASAASPAGATWTTWTVFFQCGRPARLPSEPVRCRHPVLSARRIARPCRAFGLNSLPVRFIAAPNRNTPMLALGVIIAFVVIIGAINYFEFGSVD